RIKRDGTGLPCSRAVNIFRDHDAAGRLDLDGFGIATSSLGDSVEFGNRFAEARHRNHHREPSVGLLRGKLHALLVERRDENRDMLANRLKANRKSTPEFENLAVVVQRRAGHDHVDDVDILLEARERRIELDAVKMLDDLRTAGAESDDHAAARNLIEGA